MFLNKNVEDFLTKWLIKSLLMFLYQEIWFEPHKMRFIIIFKD